MAQTLQQWHDKLVKFVPSWYFENKGGLNIADAAFWGMAAVMQQCEQDMDDHQLATFIMSATAPILDLHGDERSIIRQPGESDLLYDVQIQNGLFLSVCENELLTLINACLNNGTASLLENLDYGFYDDADLTETPGYLYYDDSYSIWLSGQKYYNWWTAIIPAQTGGVAATIQAAIISVIEANKALGTTYDVIYETNDYLLDEDGGFLLDEDGDKIIAG